MPLDSELPGFGAPDGSAADLTPSHNPNSPAPPSHETESSSSPSEVTVKEIPPRSTPGDGGLPPPPDSGDEEESGAPEMNKMTFLDHLEELRRRIFYSLIAVGIGVLVCWFFADELYAGLARPLTQLLRELHMEDTLIYTNPVSPFSLYIHLSLIAGLFVASPFILWQVWGFLSPGLYPREKKYAVPFVLLSSGLFIAGGVFAYTIAFPASLRFLLNFGHQFRPLITVNEYFSLATT
ncbi:MAG: twin-arginine translocase subunit TatC, partial [Acidobacteria bacterium]|nr:twin-arginine translocase subunit TatC [Acidobacteriota bacterium]